MSSTRAAKCERALRVFRFVAMLTLLALKTKVLRVCDQRRSIIAAVAAVAAATTAAAVWQSAISAVASSPRGARLR